jgi:hypothetical protein
MLEVLAQPVERVQAVYSHRILLSVVVRNFLEVDALVVASGGPSARQGQEPTGLVHHFCGLKLRSPPTFDLPHRRYYLLAGPIEVVPEGIEDPPSYAVGEPGLAWHYYHSANLWWPDDRAWCVATEIDMQSTYIGCSRTCVDELLGDDRLEVYEVQRSDGVRWDADDVNPKPDAHS